MSVAAKMWMNILSKPGDEDYEAMVKAYLRMPDFHNSEGKSSVATWSDLFGVTALHCAATHGDPQLVQLLLDHGADADAVDAAGEIPYDRVEPDAENTEELYAVLGAAMKENPGTARAAFKGGCLGLFLRQEKVKKKPNEIEVLTAMLAKLEGKPMPPKTSTEPGCCIIS